MSNNITAFVSGIKSAYEGEHTTSDLSLANFAENNVLQFHPFTYK
jgi:hypothetical protein